MSVISIETAMQHLRAESEDQFLIEGLLNAAEESASQFMQRRFYADQSTADAAKVDTVQRRLDARAKYDAAAMSADLPENIGIKPLLSDRARLVLNEEYQSIDMVDFGVVINPAIQAACLLILGHLYENREDVIVGAVADQLPLGSRSLLMPYRIGMGV